MFDWNDVKFLVAVARHQSTLAAGRALGVNQSTVQRRVAELERALGQPLVQRHPSGYRLTEFGLALLPHAESVERAALAFEQCAGAAERELSGVIRVTCPEPMVDRLTRSDLLARFHALYPALKVRFVMSDHYLDLRKGEVDIALRSGDTEDGELVGRKVGESLWAVYASRGFVAKHGAPEHAEHLERFDLAGFDDSMAKHRTMQWLTEVAPKARVVSRHGSVLGLLHAAKSGIGVVPLPTAIADCESDLVRLFGPVPELTRSWRILALPHVRRTPRVSALFDFLIAEVDALRPIITG